MAYRRLNTGLGFSLTDFINNATRAISGVATAASSAATDLSRIRIRPARSVPGAAPDLAPSMAAPETPAWLIPAAIGGVALLFLMNRRSRRS